MITELGYFIYDFYEMGENQNVSYLEGIDLKCGEINILTDPNFLGSMVGAIITGIIAITVFCLGNKITKDKRRKVISNYANVIQKVHDNTNSDFKTLLSVIKSGKTLKKEHQVILMEIITRGEILSLIEVTELIKESEKAFYVMEYIATYQEAVKNIVILRTKYGILDFRYNNKENDNTNIEWLEFYIDHMEKTLMNMK